MASQDFDATGTPTNVVSALSLASGTRYTGQNVSTTGTLFVRESASMPNTTDRAFKVEAGGNFTFKVDVALWLWTDDDAGCPVILDEAA